jgi:hypothetical protein
MSYVSVVPGLFMGAGLMMLGSFMMVFDSLLQMFGCLTVMFSSFMFSWHIYLPPAINEERLLRYFVIALSECSIINELSLSLVFRAHGMSFLSVWAAGAKGNRKI